MKIRLATFAVALSMLAPAFTISQARIAQERMRLTRYIYGNKFTVRVFDEDIAKMTAWDPEKEESPLSPRKAIEIARRNLPRFITKDTERWMLEGLSLEQIGRPGGNKWLYQVAFTNDGLLGSGMDYSFSIFVKMDGAIIEPEVVPNDGKSRMY